MTNLKILECFDEDLFRSIKNTTRKKDLNIETPIYFIEHGRKTLALSTSKNTICNYAIYLRCLGKRVTSNVLYTSGVTTISIFDDYFSVYPDNGYQKISLEAHFEYATRMEENRNEIYENFLNARRQGSDKCYYFVDKSHHDTIDGCTIKDAQRNPLKVVDAWALWAMFRPNANFEETIFDADENDITHQIISESTVHVVQTLSKYAENNFGKVFFSSGITLE